jgi:hypothetical protein
LKRCLDRNAGSKTSVDKVVSDRIERRKQEQRDREEEKADGERLRHGHEWEPETVQRLKQHIEEKTGSPLSRAPWPLEEDYLLRDADSCLDFEKNTKVLAAAGARKQFPEIKC